MKRTGARIITALLERQGVSTVAGIPGGSNLPLYDALRDSSIRHVLARHEQGAGFIAQGMARSTGEAAVCLATSGPGVTNLLTAIADAHLDSVPIVAITGQVPASMIGTDAFQEVDTYGLTLPITKHNFLARSAGELIEVIPQAFETALSGRPGPVVVDVPKDVQLETVEFDEWPEPRVSKPPPPCTREDIGALADILRQAGRPVLLAGGGVIASSAAGELKMLAEKNSTTGQRAGPRNSAAMPPSPTSISTRRRSARSRRPTSRLPPTPAWCSVRFSPSCRKTTASHGRPGLHR
jgi:acetolactate synthase-1/2/3 large subunit